MTHDEKSVETEGCIEYDLKKKRGVDTRRRGH